jgi:cell division control protein 24
VYHDFIARVEDWKGHNIENYGALLLYGTFDVERHKKVRPFRTYLFKGILFFAREKIRSQRKVKNLLRQNTFSGEDETLLLLRGRIHIKDIVDTKVEEYALVLSFEETDGTTVSISVFMPNENMIKEWHENIQWQRVLQDFSKRDINAVVLNRGIHRQQDVQTFI